MKGLNIYQMFILQAIAWLCNNKSKKYCFPSQEKLVEILSTSYQIKRCRRTLNYHMAYLERQGYIRRLRRTHEGENGQPVFASTIYRLCGRGLALLGKTVERISQAGIAAWNKVGNRGKEAKSVVLARVEDLLIGIKGMPTG